MDRPLFFYSEDLLGYNMGPSHPMQPRRLKLTYDLLAAYGAFNTFLELRKPTPALREVLTDTHSEAYLDMLERLDGGDYVRGADRFGFGTGDNPIFPGIARASALYTGASLDAADAILKGEGGGKVAFNISGGLHHAHHAKAAGFCVLNDCVVAIRRLRTKFTRVAYVDIDVHHGDGVQEAFYDDPSVLTVSLHESGRTLFPGTGDIDEIGRGAGEGYSLNLPFAPYTTDSTWLEAWRDAALPILQAFDPEAIVLQLGTDAHYLDPLSHLNLTTRGWLAAIADVKSLGKPIVTLGGGGYNMSTVPRMWSQAISLLAGHELHDVVPEPFATKNHMKVLNDSPDFFVVELSSGGVDRTIQFARDSTKEILRMFSSFFRI